MQHLYFEGTLLLFPFFFQFINLSVLIVNISKSRPIYIRYVSTNSENSAIHGPHKVAQTFITLNFFESFFNNSFILSIEITPFLWIESAYPQKYLPDLYNPFPPNKPHLDHSDLLKQVELLCFYIRSEY